MAEETKQLRDEIDEHRESVGQTVDQIESRVNPYKVTRRAGSRLRRRLTDMKDAVMGNDEPNYPDSSSYYRGKNPGGPGDSLVDRARRGLENVPDPTEFVRRQTKGNPFAAGMITFGVGVLLGSLLPETNTEKDVASNLEPQIRDVTREAAVAGREAVEDLREPAMEAVEDLKQSVTEAAKDVADEARATTDQRGDTT